MTAKEWLNRAYKLDKEIDILLKEKECAFTRACSIVQSTRDEKVQTSTQNSNEDRNIEYVAYSVMLDKRINELYEIKCEIIQTLNKVEDNILRSLLTCRYIKFMSWENISQELNYSRMQVYRLHGKALKKVGEVISLPDSF